MQVRHTLWILAWLSLCLPHLAWGQPPGRVTGHLVALYDFGAGNGATVYDLSGVSPAMDLTIADPSAVSWLSGGGLAVNQETRIASAGAATKLYQALTATDEFTLEVWTRPHDSDPSGNLPRRIMTFSENQQRRNFTLGLDNNDRYVLRLLAGNSHINSNGMPERHTPNGAADDDNVQHLVVTRESGGTERFYVDGVEVASFHRNGGFQNWDATFRLLLANEDNNSSRPYYGDYHLAAIYDEALSASEVAQNHQAGYSTGSVATGSLPWTEDFSLANGSTSDGGSSAWSVTYGGNGDFEVDNSQFVANNLDQEGVWRSDVIDISGAGQVQISLDWRSQGGMESNTDYLRAYYVLDGGSEVLMEARNGNFHNNQTETITLGGLSGNTLQVVIRAYNTGGAEYYYWDNVAVTTANGGGNGSGSLSGLFTAEAMDFSLFVRGDMAFDHGDVDGATAIGGDLTIDGTGQMAQQSAGSWTHNGDLVGLFIDGTVHFQSNSGINLLSQAKLRIGLTGGVNIYDTQNNTPVNTRVTGGSYHSHPRILLDHHQSASSVDHTSGSLIDFSDIFHTFRSRATAVGQLANTVNLTNANGNPLDRNNLPNHAQVYIQQLSNGDNILNLDATNVNRIQTLAFGNNGRPSASQRLVINVDAPGTFNWNNFNFSGIGANEAPYILLNFPHTTTLNINASQGIIGTVFAPDAFVFKNMWNSIQGQVIADSYRQLGGAIRHVHYQGDIPAGASAPAGLTPPTAPTCAAGNLLWQNNIDVTNLSGGNGIPQADVRLRGGSPSSYTLPITLPSAFNGPLSVTVEEAISYDGYTNRPNVGTQPEETWKVAFFLNGNLVAETGYTGDIVDGVEAAEWIGSLGTVQLPNGADEIRIIHYEDDDYGTGNSPSANSVMPSSVCLSYTPMAPPATPPASYGFTCADDVSVEVIGIGTEGQSSASLSIPHPTTADSVVLIAAWKNGSNPPATVTFDNGTDSYVASAETVSNPSNGNSCSTCRIYKGILDPAAQMNLSFSGSDMQSFVAYVFRSGTGAGETHVSVPIDRYFYRGDETFTLNIPTGVAPRDITFTIPFSEMDNDSRVANYTATAGPVSQSGSITSYDAGLGASLALVTITLPNVPANVSSVDLYIESPNSNGDSWVVAGYADVAIECSVCDVEVVATGGPDNGEIPCGQSSITLAADAGSMAPVAGLTYAYFEDGDLNELADLDPLAPVATGTSSTFDIGLRQRDDGFGFRFTGFIDIATPGTYTFYTTSDDGSKLFINGTEIVDNDGLHAAQEEQGSVSLSAGLHSIEVTFFERGGNEVLDVAYEGPGLSKQAIPAHVLFATQGASYTYQWTGPNGFGSTDQNPTVSEAGTYVVTVQEPGTVCSDTDTVIVTEAVCGPPVQDLLLTSVCSDTPSVSRRWRVRNPNSFPVEYSWRVYGTTQRDTLLAPPGDSFFFTQTVGGANTTIIAWQDENGQTQQDTRASGGVACDPCALTDGGQISGDQSFCVVRGEKVFPDTIRSVSAPSGNVAYEWLYSFDQNLPYDQWVVKRHENDAEYVPNGVKKTYYLVRRARLCPTEPWQYSNVATITIGYTPAVAFTFANDTCLSGTRQVIFTAEKVANATYTWSFPGANDPDGEPVDTAQGNFEVMTDYPGAGGTFQASLTISHGDCDSTLTLDVMVDPCSTCDNVIDGGLLSGQQASCVMPFDPSPIAGTDAQGGTGNLTYTWYHTEDPSLPLQMWDEVVGYSGKNFNPGQIDSSTYYIRSAMRDGCLAGVTSNIISVEVSANVQTLCKSWELYSQPHSFELPGVSAAGYDDRYRWNALREGGSLTSYDDDRARLQGTIVSLDHANQQWFVDLNTQPRMDWLEWQSSGHPQAGTFLPSGLGGEMDHYTWDFYAIDGSSSYLFGLDIFQEDTLIVTGGYVQRGMGANGVNGVNGIYAELTFTSTSGQYSGTAVFRNKFTQCTDVCPTTPQVAARVIMEGAFTPSTQQMRTALAENELLALQQPFNRAPWHYAGTEAVPVLPSDSLVDWVLIELRDAADSSQIVHQMAAFLKYNGDIIDTDGNSLAEAYLPVDDRPYYVVIHTRNHLSIMAQAEVNKMGRVYLYNFTTAGSIFAQSNINNQPAEEITSGVLGMMTGDAANNRAVNSIDVQRVILDYFETGYLDSDLDLNGAVNSLDVQRAILRYFRRSHVPNANN